jgi:hypothetical protein
MQDVDSLVKCLSRIVISFTKAQVRFAARVTD